MVQIALGMVLAIAIIFFLPAILVLGIYLIGLIVLVGLTLLVIWLAAENPETAVNLTILALAVFVIIVGVFGIKRLVWEMRRASGPHRFLRDLLTQLRPALTVKQQVAKDKAVLAIEERRSAREKQILKDQADRITNIRETALEKLKKKLEPLKEAFSEYQDIRWKTVERGVFVSVNKGYSTEDYIMSVIVDYSAPWLYSIRYEFCDERLHRSEFLKKPRQVAKVLKRVLRKEVRELAKAS